MVRSFINNIPFKVMSTMLICKYYNKLLLQTRLNLMEERMGFEPMKELLLYTLSKRAPSTTRPSLLYFKQYNF